jgi:hypothetical protein
MTEGPIVYDSMEHGQSPLRWKPFRRRDADGTMIDYAEPGARTSVEAGALRIEVPEFTRSHHAQQGLDNGKHVVKSTSKLILDDRSTFTVEMGAQKLNSDDDDYEDGFCMFGMADLESGFVFDMLTNGVRFWAICERLRLGKQFTWFVEAPLLHLDTTPGAMHLASITIDRSNNSVEQSFDGHTIFSAVGLETVPASALFTFGMLTFRPLHRHGRSTSLRGQGLIGWWRDFAYQGARIEPV